MTCREFVDFLMAYLDNELESRQREVFDGHITDCPGCGDYLSTYEESVRLGKMACCDEQDLAEEAPEDLVNAILAARETPPS